MPVLSLAIVFMLFFPTIMIAQEQSLKLAVDSSAELDLSAVIPSSKKDVNGKQVAGIKVFTNLTNLSFEASNGIVDVQAKTGEFVVFVSSNERKLTIRAQGYLPLELILSEVGIRLESGQVWEITVTGEKKSELIPVNFIISPVSEDVQLIIDEMNANSAESIPLTSGEHVLKIERKGYKTIIDTVQVALNQSLFRYVMKPLLPVSVKIDSDIDGVQIVINGVDRGFAPYKDYLVPGEYQVEWRKSGYLTKTEQIQVTESGLNEFSNTLNSTTGQINWTVKPASAKVTINNKVIKQNPYTLAAGIYLVQIEAEGYEPYQEQLQIQQLEQIERVWALKPFTGRVLLSSAPSNAKGSLYFEQSLLKTWTGLLDTTLQAGKTYWVKFEAKGYEEQSNWLELSQGEVKRLRVELKSIDKKTQVKIEEPRILTKREENKVANTQGGRESIIRNAFIIRSGMLLNNRFSTNFNPGFGLGLRSLLLPEALMNIRFEIGGLMHSVKNDVTVFGDSSIKAMNYWYGSVGIGFKRGPLFAGADLMQSIYQSKDQSISFTSVLGVVELSLIQRVGIVGRYGIYSNMAGETYADVGLRVNL